MYFFGDDRFADLKVEDGRILVHHRLKLLLHGGSGLPPYFNLELDVEVSTPDPGERAGPPTQLLPWEITKFRLMRAVPTEKGSSLP